MVLAAIDLIARHGSQLTEAEVRHGLHGNLCRCTGYEFIVDAILAAASDHGPGTQPPADEQDRPS